MSDFDINRAARMMRAGNEFSQTNKKLSGAVLSFVQWLFDHITEYQLPDPENIGWKIEKLNKGTLHSQIRLTFQTDSGEWQSITTNCDPLCSFPEECKKQMNQVVDCCRTLAGTGGERLIAWLEAQSQERKQMIAAFEAMRTLRSVMNSAPLA